jgi:UDP:flavonoid glycosyltransferase YjiC (YdhE family)
VVVVNDPISGQGANNASHAAGMYLKAILDRGSEPFDPAWMQRTFDEFWAHAQNSITLTELFLEPLPEHGVDILVAAAQYPEVAKRVADWYPFPATLHDFALDPEKTAAYLKSVAAPG